MNEDQKFEVIVNRGMEKYFKRNPRIAVKLGKEDYEKVVESGTKEHIVDNLKFFSKWIDELKQLDGEKLNFENQISLKAMVVAEAIIAHLTNLPNYLEEFQSRFDETPIPIVWRDLALEQVQAIPKFLQILAEAFSKTSEVPESLKNKLLKNFKETESVIHTHIEWIKSLPVDSEEFAWALGPENFDKLLSLRRLPWDRNTLLKKGNKLFSSAFKKLKQLAKEFYPGKTLSEAIEEFYKEDQVPSFQEVLKYAQSEAKRTKEFIISHNLATFPKEKLIIIETPPHLIPIIPSAAYDETPYFKGEQPGIFMITPSEIERYSYTMISNWMIHEAYPGHHLDFVCNNKYAPLIRLLGGFESQAYETVEGWALYCQDMMLQQGFNKDPIKTQLLFSGSQVGRAMTILLDIQMHCKQRTMADASKMLMDIVQTEESVAKTQILGNTLEPVYPLSYSVGKLLIEDLRLEVEEKMGSKFSLKFFHDTILRSGDLPYYLLKEYFEEKIKNLLSSNS